MFIIYPIRPIKINKKAGWATIGRCSQSKGICAVEAITKKNEKDGIGTGRFHHKEYKRPGAIEPLVFLDREGMKNGYLTSSPQTILVAITYKKSAKIRLSWSTGRACASLTPSGAVNTLVATIPARAGR